MSLKVSERGYIKKEYSNLEYSFFIQEMINLTD